MTTIQGGGPQYTPIEKTANTTPVAKTEETNTETGKGGTTTAPKEKKYDISFTDRKVIEEQLEAAFKEFSDKMSPLAKENAKTKLNSAFGE